MNKAFMLVATIFFIAVAVKLIGTPNFMPWGIVAAFLGGFLGTLYEIKP